MDHAAYREQGIGIGPGYTEDGCFEDLAAAIRNAATVFLPSENPDPVNVASTPIFTVRGVAA